MKKILALTLIAGLATAGAQTYTTGTGLSGVELGLTGGYAGGLSGEVFLHAPNVAGPFGVKLGVSYTRPSDAINDNADIYFGTFPTPVTFGSLKEQGATEYGSRTVVGLDATYNVGELTPGLGAVVYAGGRYGMFRSTIDVGETTTYSSNAFGVGAGVMVSYPLAGNLSVVGDLGIDQFFRSSITSYNSLSGQSDTFATSDASYAGVSDLFVRPGTVFKARIGLKTSF